MQDISEDDARAEGCLPATRLDEAGTTYSGDPNGTYRAHFWWIWDSLNAKRGYSWESNPWVWALTFQHA